MCHVPCVVVIVACVVSLVRRVVRGALCRWCVAYLCYVPTVVPFVEPGASAVLYRWCVAHVCHGSCVVSCRECVAGAPVRKGMGSAHVSHSFAPYGTQVDLMVQVRVLSVWRAGFDK